MAQHNNNLDFSSLFKLDTIINLKISSYSFYEIGLKKFVSLASEDELIFLYIDAQGQRTEKKYDWNFCDDPIHCMCFEPTGTWVLIVSSAKVLLLPFLPLFTSQDTFDCKWSLSSITPLYLGTTNNANSVVWWLTKETENILIIGKENGSISFFSLDSKSIVGECKLPSDIKDLQICFDDSLDLLALIITGVNSKQWKLILEHRSLNYNWLQQNSISQTEKDKKEGFMSYIKQLSKDKITLFTQGTQKDGCKSQSVEYTVKPTEYLPIFRRGSNNWALSTQYANGHHFLTAFDVNEGTIVLEGTEEETPSRTLKPNIDTNGSYQQGLWSQRLLYLFKKNEIEVHSSSYSIVQGLDGITKENTLLWSTKLIGEVQRGHLMSSREPCAPAAGWREPTFLCDLQLPRFNLEPCLIVTNRGLHLLNTVGSPCEWLVAGVARGGAGAERAAAALGAPVPALLRAAADLLLSRGKAPAARYLYSLSQYHRDGWLARLGVFGKLDELCIYKEHISEQTAQQTGIGSSALTIKLLAQIIRHCTNADEKLELDNKLTCLNTMELEELCCISAALGLWDLVPTFSISCGRPNLLMTAIKNRNVICRGALNCLMRQRNMISILEEDGTFIFDFIKLNCDKFDLILLKRLCIWLCPLQDQFRPVFRDLKQKTTTIYTNRLQLLIDTFMNVVTSLDAKEKCPEISTKLPQHTQTWKSQFTPRTNISCGLSHWAITYGGDAKVVLTNTPIRIDSIGRVTSVACGRHHTLVLTENGVYSSGDNTYGQLGVGRAWRGAVGDNASASGSVLFVAYSWGAPLVAVAAGHYHSAAVDAGGRLYTWGWGVHGQLGLGSIDDECSPRLVTKLQGRKVVSVGCGCCHTVALLANGEVWCCGGGAFGQLGGAGPAAKLSAPARLALPDAARLLAVGYFHNLVVTVKDELWCWGASPQSVRAAHARRQAAAATPPGAAAPPPAAAPPERPPHLAPSLVDTQNVTGRIVRIAAGWHHSCLLDDTGAVYTWGLNFDGQLGIGSRKQLQIPTEVKIDTENVPFESPTTHKSCINIKSSFSKPDTELGPLTTKAFVACGGDYTIYVDDDGKIFITGNTHQQVNSETGNPANRVIMMKTTKRVIKIPANRSNNKFVFQFVDRIYNLLDADSACIQRIPIEPGLNPLEKLADFTRKSWPDDIVMLLKPWIKEDILSTNLNMKAKFAYHNKLYSDCLKYLLQDLNNNDNAVILYLQHTEPTFKVQSDKDIKMFMKNKDVLANIKTIIATRIKEISISILNEDAYPSIQPNVFKALTCCCDELKHLPHISSKIQNNNDDGRRSISSKAAAEIIDTCIGMFPEDRDLWETCFNISKDFYLVNKLPINDLELVLQKYMKVNAKLMTSALMFSNDCTQFSEILSPKFFLSMCTEILDTWG